MLQLARMNELDFRDPKLIIELHKANANDIFIPDLHAIPGYSDSGDRRIDLGTTIKAEVGWTVLLDFILFDRQQIVQNFRIETTAWKAVSVSVEVALLLRNGVSQNTSASIRQAFLQYQYPGSGDAEAYLEQELVNNPEVSRSDFLLGKVFKVLCLETQPHYDQTKFAALQQFLQNTHERYSAKLVNETVLPYMPPVPLPNETEIGNIQKAVDQVASNYKEHSPACDGFETEWQQFARMDAPDQIKVEWGWQTVTIGCTSFDLYLPRTYHRRAEYVAAVYVTFARELALYKSALKDCAIQAASAAIVVGIVFSDLTTALATFKGLFWKCVMDKFTVALDCVDAGIVVDTRVIDDWH